MNRKKEVAKKEPVKKVFVPTNSLIENIVSTYPKSISCHPRGAFESQLRLHLSKCGVKQND